MNILKGFLWGLCLCIVISAVLECHEEEDSIITVQSDTTTVTVYDTVIVQQPVAVDSVVLRYEMVRLPILSNPSKTGKDCDTLSSDFQEADSTEVVVPITQRHYKDSLYEAWISGYRPCLDSIRLSLPRTTTTIEVFTTETRKVKKRPYSVNLGVGYGVSTRGEITPYVGLTVGYTLFSW